MSNSEQKRRLSPEMASFRLLVLSFVRDYIAEHRGSPSYGEIAAALDTDKSHVYKAIRSLCADALLISKGGPRSLCLPSSRDEAIRQLRELGWTVDEEANGVKPGETKPPLLPPPALDYP